MPLTRCCAPLELSFGYASQEDKQRREDKQRVSLCSPPNAESSKLATALPNVTSPRSEATSPKGASPQPEMVRRQSEMARSFHFDALQTSFNLNFLIYPALENGKEMSAIDSILDYAKMQLGCEMCQLCIVDPKNKTVNVSFGTQGKMEGYKFGLVDNVFEHTLLNGVGVNYYGGAENSSSTEISNYPGRIVLSEMGLERKFKGFKSKSVLTLPVLDTNLAMVAFVVARNKEGEDTKFTPMDELRLASISQTVTIVLHQCHIQEHLGARQNCFNPERIHICMT